jgi:hypothetical protein
LAWVIVGGGRDRLLRDFDRLVEIGIYAGPLESPLQCRTKTRQVARPVGVVSRSGGDCAPISFHRSIKVSGRTGMLEPSLQGHG